MSPAERHLDVIGTMVSREVKGPVLNERRWRWGVRAPEELRHQSKETLSVHTRDLYATCMNLETREHRDDRYKLPYIFNNLLEAERTA